MSWPYLLGKTPSIVTSRLTGLVLQSGTLLAIASLLKPREVFGPAGAALLIASIYLGAQSSADFVHYSSELVSLALLSGVAAILTGIQSSRPAPWRWGLCGVLVACLPLAKLQSSVLAALLGSVCLARLAIEAWRSRAAVANAIAFTIGICMPIVALVLPPFWVGEGQAVIEGYVLLGAGYAGMRSLTLFQVFGFYIGLMAQLFLCTLAFRSRAHSRETRRDLYWLAVGLWPALFLTVWLPGRNFAHYCQYFVVGLPLAIGLAERALPRPAGRPPWIVNASALTAVIVSGLGVQGLAVQAWKAHEDVKLNDRFATTAGVSSRDLYAWTGATDRDSLLMWGWEPQLTAYAGLKSADRAAHAEYMIRANRGREYFRSRLIRDIKDNLPALVLDTVKPGYFFENDPGFDWKRSGLDSFPALNALVRDRYERISGATGCASLYLRDDLVPAWRSAEVELSSSIPQLVTGAMSEKCGEWWAPEPYKGAVALLSPARAEPLSEVWILASRGGRDRDRGTTSVRLTFVTPGGDREQRLVRLLDYPRWTVVQCTKNDAVAQIEVESLTFVGSGPAIAGVKAFRPSRVPHEKRTF